MAHIIADSIVKPKILIVEDNRELALLCKEALDDRFQVELAGGVGEARRINAPVDGVVLDLQLPDGDGL